MVFSSLDDRITLFRQQATVIARKKESTAERLGALMQEATRLAHDVEEKEQSVQRLPKV